jgi:predicted transcriptional regulator of viral defense system
MNSNLALKSLSDVTGSQWGLVTVQQAEQVGVSRLILSRLLKQGHLERVRQGVYQDIGSPTSPATALQAHWLSFKPAVLASTRLRHLEGEAVVASTTASWLRQEGDFLPEPFSFYYPQRVQKSSTGIRVMKGSIPDGDIEITEGLPTTTRTKTMLDLFTEGRDLGGMRAIIQDGGIRDLDIERVRRAGKQLAARYGQTTKAFSEQLEQILQSSAIAAFTKLGLDETFAELNDSTKAMREQFAELQKTLNHQLDVPDLSVLVRNFERLQLKINSVSELVVKNRFPPK